MSRLETIEKKRARLTPEKQAALEERLRRAVASSAEATASQPHESVAAMVSQWEAQTPPGWIDWATITQAARRQSQQAPADLDLRTVPLLVEATNRLSVAYICAALRGLGAYTRAGESHCARELVERFHILPQYAKLMSRWLTVLAEEGLLTRDGASFNSPSPLPADLVESTLGVLSADTAYGEYAGVMKLMQANGENLCAMITGRRIALENFFAGGSSDLPEVVYQSAPHARYFNRIVRELLETVARAMPRSRQLRVMEVGGGVGGTTAPLLPSLPPDETVYVFTDISSYFLKNAERMFEKYPFVRFHSFNIDENPHDLGFEPNLFDVVVGANVLHCARDLPATLRGIGSLLQPGGLLILIEVTRAERWHNIAMGLLTGFLNFEDERLKDNEPLLSCARWKEVLRTNGFARFAAFPEAGVPAEVMGQHVLLAQNSRGAL